MHGEEQQARANAEFQDLLLFRLKDLRARLLNLSTNNKLLSTKFGQRSRAQIRCVDELPNILLKKLSTSRMTFKALPPLEEELADEKTEDFKDALNNARLTDEIYQKELEAIEEKGALELNDEMYDLERRLKDRAREQLKLPPRQVGQQHPSLPAHAKAHHIDPNYDLPEQTVDVIEERWTDSNIQLLLLPDEMDRTLSYIVDQARTLRQETGIETLHMAFGFLEWSEPNSSSKTHFAPLMLLPVEIEREQLSGAYRFHINSRGDDPSINITLAEKLKLDFKLALPELNLEEDTPEKYWSKVKEDVIRHKPTWKLRRWVAIGVFPFARMAMYHDLNPDNWNILDKGLVREMLGGKETEDYGIASDYEIDNPEIEDIAPILITSADTSQHSAVIDAVKGKSFAIKGPPGTGKSQTITNIIGAALYAGKTVLFVAEKMPALKVVYNRLNSLGLAGFCLELHSNKASRKPIYESLATRIGFTQRNRQLNTASELEESRALREELTKYVAILNSQYGRTGSTIQEIFWEARRIFDSTPLSKEIKDLRVQESWTYDRKAIDKVFSIFRDFSNAHIATFSSGYSLANHPWRGFSKPLTMAFDLEDIRERAKSWNATVLELVNATSLLKEKVVFEDQSISGWTQINNILKKGLELLDEKKINIIKNLKTKESRNIFLQGISALEGLRLIDGKIAGKLSLKEANSSQIRDTSKIAVGVGLLESPINEFEKTQKNSELEHQKLKGSLQFVIRIATQIGIEQDLKKDEIQALKNTLNILSEQNEGILATRTQGMLEQRAVEFIELMQKRCLELKNIFQNLSSRYLISDSISEEELNKSIEVLKKTNLASIFSGEWRKCRNVYKNLLIKKSKEKPSDMAKSLVTICDFLKRKRVFERDVDLARIIGPHNKGLGTDFSVVLAAAKYVRSIKKGFPFNSDFEVKVKNFLLDSDPDLLISLSSDKIRASFNLIDQKFEEYSSTERVSDILKQTEIKVSKLKKLGEGICKIPGLKGSVLFSELEFIANLVDQRRELEPRALNSNFEALVPGEIWKGSDTPIEALRDGLSIADGISNLPENIADTLFNDPSRITEIESLTSNILSKASPAINEFLRLESDAHISSEFFNGRKIDEVPINELFSRSESCSREDSQLERMAAWVNARAMCKEGGLGEIVDKGYACECEPKKFSSLWQAILRRSQIEDIYKINGEELKRLSGSKQARARESFQSLENKLRDLSRQELVNELMRKDIPHGRSTGRKSEWTDMALIDNEINKQQKFIPIRDLFSRATKAIQGLKPCFLMSPQSVAQYLPCNQINFDLIVIDEASQMKPEYAIGALARASQVIVVGDEKQLPPTDFFEKESKSIIEEEDYADEQISEDSILEKALTVFRPARHLRLHYRSQHSGLIAFSNRHFYEDRLVTFPSAHEGNPHYGPCLIQIDGLYNKGTNPIEAKAIVAAAIDHMKRRPSDSLGIVSINQTQRELIREELDVATSLDPLARKFISFWSEKNDGLEELFIKNLESVQGDERDVIMISTVYGRSSLEQTAPAQRFGPINGVNGARRLNVLFTRAKKQTIVFSSLKPTDIKVSEESHFGVRIFRDYLAYAMTGILESGIDRGDLPDSPFEEWIIERIEAMGCTAVPQVGVMGYRIDIGVKHPGWPYGYIMGVECDGATYHSAPSVRERDQLRQEILENLGWRLYRIWSTDWFSDPTGETEKLKIAIKGRIDELIAGRLR
jgi:hypothetical protein